MKRQYALAALIRAAAASSLPRNALAARCNRTIRLGVYRRVITIILSRRPIVLSTFLSSG